MKGEINQVQRASASVLEFKINQLFSIRTRSMTDLQVLQPSLDFGSNLITSITYMLAGKIRYTRCFKPRIIPGSLSCKPQVHGALALKAITITYHLDNKRIVYSYVCLNKEKFLHSSHPSQDARIRKTNSALQLAWRNTK
jgi:hypothetical protein